MKITNNSRALQGIWSVDGLIFLEVGETREVDVADDHVERTKSLPFLSIDDSNEVDSLEGKTVAELRELAEAEEIDLGDAAKKADIIAAIELARETGE